MTEAEYRRLPLLTQTAYARLLDLLMTTEAGDPASDATMVSKTIRGRRYWYAQRQERGKKVQRYIGSISESKGGFLGSKDLVGRGDHGEGLGAGLETRFASGFFGLLGGAVGAGSSVAKAQREAPPTGQEFGRRPVRSQLSQSSPP